MSYEEGSGNPWIPSSGRPVTDDWAPGDGAQVGGALLLDGAPWFLLALCVLYGAPTGLIGVAAVLVVLACLSLAVGAVTKRSLVMRFFGWPAGTIQPRTEYGAAWIELFLLFIIVFASRPLGYFGLDWTLGLAVLTCAVAGVSALLTVLTGRSIGRRLLRVIEEL